MSLKYFEYIPLSLVNLRIQQATLYMVYSAHVNECLVYQHWKSFDLCSKVMRSTKVK